VQHYVIIGDRGLGKSSVLNFIARELSSNTKTLTIMIFGDRILSKKQFYDQLVEGFLESFSKKKNLPVDLKENYTKALSTISSALSLVSSVSFGINLGPIIQAAFTALENKRTWRKYADQAIGSINRVSKENNFHTVILLDDFDTLIESLGSDFVQDFRGRISETTSTSLISTATNASFFTRNDQPFYSFFKIYPMESLTVEEVREFLIEKAKKENVSFTDESIGRIYSLSKGWPLYLRSLTREASLSAILDHRSCVSESDVEIGLRNMLINLEPAFRANYDSLSVVQKAILRAVSKGCNTPSLIYKEVKLPRGSIGPSIERVVEKGKLQKAGKASYKISDPLFEEWLREKSIHS
jgi:AAA+ ATPase superfamily predicted ATPase